MTNQVFQEGYNSYHDGVNRCPYQVGTDNFFDWNQGYMTAADQDVQRLEWALDNLQGKQENP